MDDDRPLIESRTRRLLAYVEHNGDRMAVDVLALFAWIVATASVAAWFDLPTWLLYVALFAGVVVYSRVTPPWERPYRSPE